MSMIANLRGALGLKPDRKARPKERKGLPPISKKRRAYLASDERKVAKAHMARVAELPCLVCGARPVEVHHEHIHAPKSDWNVMPLCPPHHRREFGPGARHYSPTAFFAEHGTAEELLARVADILQNSA